MTTSEDYGRITPAGGRKNMGRTSTEVKTRWKKKAYKLYQVNLRYDTDDHLIEFIEANKERIGMTEIFREALEMYMEANGK